MAASPEVQPSPNMETGSKVPPLPYMESSCSALLHGRLTWKMESIIRAPKVAWNLETNCVTSFSYFFKIVFGLNDNWLQSILMCIKWLCSNSQNSKDVGRHIRRMAGARNWEKLGWKSQILAILDNFSKGVQANCAVWNIWMNNDQDAASCGAQAHWSRQICAHRCFAFLNSPLHRW